MGSIPGWCCVHSGLMIGKNDRWVLIPCRPTLSPCAPTRVIRESSDDPAGHFPGDYPGVFFNFRDLFGAFIHALLALRPDDTSSRQ